MHCNEGLFSHFLRSAEGQEPNIAFFAGLPVDAGGFRALPLMPVPYHNDSTIDDGVVRYTVLSSTAAYFVTELTTLRFVVRVFIGKSKEVCFSVHVRNLSDQPQKLFVADQKDS